MKKGMDFEKHFMAGHVLKVARSNLQILHGQVYTAYPCRSRGHAQTALKSITAALLAIEKARSSLEELAFIDCGEDFSHDIYFGPWPPAQN